MLKDGTLEEYAVTMPNIYARGILFGTLIMEIGDSASVKCPSTGYTCDLDFKTKGFISGTYNALSGKVRDLNENIIYTVSGKWTEALQLEKSKKVGLECHVALKRYCAGQRAAV